jgi:hypothetical protein
MHTHIPMPQKHESLFLNNWDRNKSKWGHGQNVSNKIDIQEG